MSIIIKGTAHVRRFGLWRQGEGVEIEIVWACVEERCWIYLEHKMLRMELPGRRRGRPKRRVMKVNGNED